MAMKAKKLYTGAFYRDLTHEKAKCYCLQNPDFVMTRRGWDGYHFIKDGDYYMMLKSGILLNCGSCLDDLSEKVWDMDKKDWITAHRSQTGVKFESNAVKLKWTDYKKIMEEYQKNAEYYQKNEFKTFKYYPYKTLIETKPDEEMKLPTIHGE